MSSLGARRPAASSGEPTELIRLGRIGRPHGLKGALTAHLDSPDSTAFEKVDQIFLEGDGGRSVHAVRGTRRLSARTVRLVLDGVATIDAAEALRDRTILVVACDLPPPKPGEFYSFRAIGCEVVTTAGRRLGTVAEIFGTGANDVMVVRDEKTEKLIPIIADVVKDLDFAGRTITIEELPGLLD